MKRNFNHKSAGFTLVELLVVIAIIGILVGLAIPAVLVAVNRATEFSYKTEVDLLQDAMEKYRSIYDDYPPDGSSWEVFRRHCRRSFPNILASELALFDPTNRPVSDIAVETFGGQQRVMQPQEALVLFLGGLSDDPQRPFTGSGGPLILDTNGNIISYNGRRENALFEFRTEQLTLNQAIGSITSTDEADFGLPPVQGNDVRLFLPAYTARNINLPFVYFDSRTYVVDTSGTHFNRSVFYSRPGTEPRELALARISFDIARPYLSDNIDANGIPLFMGEDTFQIVMPGRDGIFGAFGFDARGIATLPGTEVAPVYHRIPSGASIVGGATSNSGSGGFTFGTDQADPKFQTDNVADFSRSTLETGL